MARGPFHVAGEAVSRSRPECRECAWFTPGAVMGFCEMRGERRDPQDERAAWCARFVAEKKEEDAA